MKLSPRIHVLLMLLLVGVAWIHQASYDFVVDDAFISYRYASNWASGHGAVFNAGERVEGYSNFLWVGVLALLRFLGFDIIAASRHLGTAAYLAVIVLVYATLVGPLRRDRGVGLAGGMVVALHAGAAAHARSGLETLPLTALVLTAQMCFLAERRAFRDHWGTGVWVAVASLLRADGVVYALPILLFLMFRRRSRREVVSFVIPLLLVVLPHAAWRFGYYGDVLPNTYYVRVGGDLYQQLRGLLYLYTFVVPFGGLVFFALPLLLITLHDPERDQARAFLGLFVLVTFAYVVWVGGDYMPMGRFLIPIVPAVTILQLESLAEMWRHIEVSRLVTRTQAARAMVVSVVVIGLSGLAVTLVPRRDSQVEVIATKALTANWTLAGRWFHEHCDPNTTLAAEPVGALGYYSGLRIIDMLGINDRHIAHAPAVRPRRGKVGHEKSDFTYVLSRRPQLIFERISASVRAECDTTFEDGSVYARRCVTLGIGSHFDRRGVTWQAPVYMWFSARRSRPHGPMDIELESLPAGRAP